MLENDGKVTVLRTVRSAELHVIEKQATLRQEIEEFSKVQIKMLNFEHTEQAVREFYAAVDSMPAAEHPWLPAELDQIPDTELRGMFGIYDRTLCQLEFMHAAREFYRLLAACN